MLLLCDTINMSQSGLANPSPPFPAARPGDEQIIYLRTCLRRNAIVKTCNFKDASVVNMEISHETLHPTNFSCCWRQITLPYPVLVTTFFISHHIKQQVWIPRRTNTKAFVHVNNYDHGRGAHIPGARSPWRLNFIRRRLILWVFSTELAPCHPSCAWNVEVANIFVVNLCAPALRSHECDTVQFCS
jgi:hypothetical protein